MKLRPITRSEIHTAAALLCEGFPNFSLATWQESARHLFALVERQGHESSIGYIVQSGGQDVGISLAIPSMRSAYESAPRKVVNLAAFYLKPGNEWMTTLFLRRMMKDPSVEYVDLTAVPQMREVNRRLGFMDRTRGTAVISTALAALRPSRGVRIIPFADLSAGMLPSEQYELLEQHNRLHAICLAVQVDGICHPLILVRNQRKRLVGARVILARDRALIRAAAGPLARYLLKTGVMCLEFDSPAPFGIIGSVFVANAAPVQTTWPIENAAIDHTFSELLFVPPPSHRPAPATWSLRRNSSLPFPLGLVEASITAAPAASLVLSLAEMLPT